MKQLLLSIFPFLLFANTYTFSGVDDNVVQIVAGKVLNKAYSRVDIPVNIIFQQAEASLQASNTGAIDGEVARIKNITKEYSNLLIVDVPLATVKAVAYSNKTHINIRQWSDLKDYNFTVVKGAKFIEKATQGYQRQKVNSFAQALKDLHQGKTEIIIIPKKAAVKLILENDYKNIHIVSPILKTLKLYHFVHKKNAHLIPIIKPVLQQMKDSGEIEHIRNSYLRSLTK